MINLLIHLLFVTTTIGMIFMEFGSFGRTIDQYGYANGATFSYLIFWMLFYVAYYGIQRYSFVFHSSRCKQEFNEITYYYEDSRIYKALIFILIFSLFFLIIQVFVFNGISVLTGTMLKNEFRTTGVTNGLLAFGILKFYAPGIGALATYFFLKAEEKKVMMFFLLFIIYIFLFIIGLSWGYKSSGISILLPSFALLFWRISLWKFFLFFVIAMCFFAFLALQFDTSVVKLNSYSDALMFVFERITVYQSETPWKIWDSYINGITLPNYTNTLIGLFGNILPRILDLNVDYISSNYGLSVTYFVYPYEKNILNGFNTTSTFYSESIIAFGYIGLLIFPILGGLMAGTVVKKIEKNNKKPIKIVLLLLVFFSCIYPWMSSGGISALFHVSVFLHLVISYMLFQMLLIFINSSYKKGIKNVITY